MRLLYFKNKRAIARLSSEWLICTKGIYKDKDSLISVLLRKETSNAVN